MEQKPCVWCGTLFFARRKDKRTCSPVCRQQRSRKRRERDKRITEGFERWMAEMVAGKGFGP